MIGSVSHKHNGNFQPLLQSFTPEQKQMQKIARQDMKSGNVQGCMQEWRQIRSTYTPQQQALSDQAREKSGMPLIDWQPGSGQYLPIKSKTTNQPQQPYGNPAQPPSATPSTLNYSA